jgi:hypothetical protein
MNFSCLHKHVSAFYLSSTAFFNNFISQSSSPSWIKGLWFKRSVARLVLISFTFGQLAPLVPAHASYQEEFQDGRGQSPSTPLLVRTAQQNEPPQPQALTRSQVLLARAAAQQAQNLLPAPVVPAPQINAAPQASGVPVLQGAAPQPQDLTMSELLLARLAAQQAQNLLPAPVVPAPQINAAPQASGVPVLQGAAPQPQDLTMSELLLARLAAQQAQTPAPDPVIPASQINAAPQVHGVPVIPSAYLSLGPIGRSPLWNYGEGSKIPAIREMAHADAFLSWPAETPFAQEMTTELRRTANLVTGDKFISCVNEEESTGSQLRAKIFDGLAQHRLTLEALLAAVQTHHSGISLSLGNIPALGMCGVDGHYPGERAVAQWIEQLCSTIGTQQFYLRVIEMFLKDAAQPGRNILPNPQLSLETGGALYIHKVPGIDNGCGFYSLGLTRAWGTQLLLEQANKKPLRDLVAPEIMNRMRDAETLPRELLEHPRCQTLLKRSHAALTRRASAEENEAIDAEIRAYTQEQDTYERYIRSLALPGIMLEFSPGVGNRHATGVFDALAYLQQKNLKIYQADSTGKGVLVHNYVYAPSAEIVELYHTWFEASEEQPEYARNHYDCLSATPERPLSQPPQVITPATVITQSTTQSTALLEPTPLVPGIFAPLPSVALRSNSAMPTPTAMKAEFKALKRQTTLPTFQLTLTSNGTHNTLKVYEQLNAAFPKSARMMLINDAPLQEYSFLRTQPISFQIKLPLALHTAVFDLSWTQSQQLTFSSSACPVNLSLNFKSVFESPPVVPTPQVRTASNPKVRPRLPAVQPLFKLGSFASTGWLDLKTGSTLIETLTGNIEAKAGLRLSTTGQITLRHRGQMSSSGLMVLLANELTNHGLTVSAERLYSQTAYLRHYGGVLTGKELFFNSDNLNLSAPIHASQDLLINANKSLMYGVDFLKANRLLWLTLGPGFTKPSYSFTKPIKTPGALQIDGGKTGLANLTDIEAGLDMALTSPSTVTTGQEKGVFATLKSGGILTVQAPTGFDIIHGGVFGERGLQLSTPQGGITVGRGIYDPTRFYTSPDGSYLSTLGTMLFESKTFHNLYSDVYIRGGLLSLAHFDQLLNRAGTLRVDGPCALDATALENLRDERRVFRSGFTFAQLGYVLSIPIPTNFTFDDLDRHSKGYLPPASPPGIFSIGGQARLSGGTLNNNSSEMYLKGTPVADARTYQHVLKFNKFLQTKNEYLNPKDGIPIFEATAPLLLKAEELANYTGAMRLQQVKFDVGTMFNSGDIQGQEIELKAVHVHNKGTIEAAGTLTLDLGSLLLEQPVLHRQVAAIINKKNSTSVTITVPQDGGNLRGHTIRGTIGKYRQIGGELRSGTGGTHLVLNETAYISALQTTSLEQGRVTRKGTNYALKPQFHAALMVSEGDQIIVVLEGGLEAGGLHSFAGGNNTLLTRDRLAIESVSQRYTGPSSGKRHVTSVTSTITLRSTFTSGKDSTLNSQDSDVIIEDSEVTAPNGRVTGTGGRDALLKGATTQSKFGTHITATRNLSDEAKAIVNTQTTHSKDKHEGTESSTTVHQQPSVHGSEGPILFTAEQGTVTLQIPEVDAERFEVRAHGDIIAPEAHDSHHHQVNKKRQAQGGSGTHTSRVMNIKSKQPALFSSSTGNIIITAPTIDAPRTIIHAPQGRVALPLGTNHHQSCYSRTSSNGVRDKTTTTQQDDHTYTAGNIKGILQIYSLETILEMVKGQPLAFLEQIEQHGGPVVKQLLEEYHHYHSQTKRTLSQGATAVITVAASIAATLATGGLATTITQAMVQGALGALSAQTTIGMVNHEGNLGRVFKDMTSEKALRSLAVTVAAAGLMQHIGNTYDLARPTAEQVQTLSTGQLLTQHFKYNLLNAGVSTTLNATIGGQKLDEALKCGLKGAVVSTVGGLAANQIGLVYKAGDLNAVTHKLIHGLVGGATGAVLGDDPLKGAVAGATGAMLAEMVMEAMMPDPQATVTEMVGQANQEGRSFDFEEFKDLLTKQTNIAKLAVALSALVLEQDVNVAVNTATNAVGNNWVQIALAVGIPTAKILIEIYTLIYEDEIEATKQDICSYVAEKLGYSPGFVEFVFDGAMMAGSTFQAVKQGGKMIAKKFVKTGATEGAKALKAPQEGPKESALKSGVEGEKPIGNLKQASQSQASTQQLGDPKNIASHEKHKVELRKQMQAPHVKNSKLKKIIEQNYRENAEIGSGSTAEALRHEKLTGEAVKGKFHTQKVEEMINRLDDWIKQNPNALTKDKAAAENVLKDLNNAQGK